MRKQADGAVAAFRYRRRTPFVPPVRAAQIGGGVGQVLYSFNHTAYRLLPLRAVRIGVDSENAVMQTRDFVWNEDEGGADQSLPLLPEAPFSDGRFSVRATVKSS